MNLKGKKNNFVEVDRILGDYLNDINKYKILTPAEETDLLMRIKAGDEEARKKLISHNLRFVYSVAKNYANEDNLTDLITAGNIGLIQALDSFEIERGNRFLSHAVWYIRREINAFLNTDGLLIRKTNNTKTVYKISKIRSSFFAENNRYPTVNELANILEKEYGMKIKDKNDLLDVTIASISTCYDDEDSKTFENSPEFTEKTAVENDYERSISDEYQSSLSKELLEALSDRERTIIKMAFGMGYNKEFTNAEIGEAIGMSSERVRQLKHGAIEKLQQYVHTAHLSL